MSKKSNRRDCPATGNHISSAECGEGRNSRYDCPLECPHNPYHADNYDRILEIEERVDDASIKEALKDPLVAKRVSMVLSKNRDEPFELSGSMIAALFHDIGEDGMTFWERWAKAGYSGLRNDHRVLAESKMRTGSMLLEVQSIEDENRVICIDLLGDPLERLTFCDRSFAGMACRFQRIFALAYRTSAYWRLAGSIVELKDFEGVGPQESLEIIAAHLGGDLSTKWLGSNFVKIAQSIFATRRERHRLKLAKTDFRLAKVDYELGEFEDQFAKRLVKAGCIEEDVEDEEADAGFQRTFIWPDRISKDAIASSMGGTPYLGSVLLKPGLVRLNASRMDLLAELRKKFEKMAGKKIRFIRELIEDIAAQKAGEIEESDLALIPPLLLENVSGTHVSSSLVDLSVPGDSKQLTIGECLERYYRQLLDEPLALLDGLTPNQAAKDFVVRPKLVEWAKGAVLSVDKQSLLMGVEIDINWMLKELNLSEIDFPTPPIRDAIGSSNVDEADEDYWDEDDEELEDDGDMEFFWETLIFERMEDYDTAQVALDEMKAMGFDLVDDFFELTRELLNEGDYALFVTVIIMIWVAIVPRGRNVSCKRELSARSLDDIIENAPKIMEGFAADDIDMLGDYCREPELFLFLATRISDIAKTVPRKRRPSKETIGAMCLVSIAAINAASDATSNGTEGFGLRGL